MKYYELTTTVFVKKTIPLDSIGFRLGNLVKGVMNKNNFLTELHGKKTVKLFGYDYLYPRAENKQYHEGRVYFFRIRTPLQEIAKAFDQSMSGYEDDFFKVIAKELQIKKFMHKEELYTTTPAICTLRDKYWVKEFGIDVIKEKMERNLVTKYTAFYGEEPGRKENFINYVSLKNHKPISVKYKSGSLIGNKFVIGFGSDEEAIKMTYLAFTASILEKSSSIGSGFCI